MEAATTPARSPLAQSATRRRGIALVLLMVALVVGTVLSLSFLVAQSTSIGISQNLQNQPNARMIAETALGMGVAAINADPNWRSDYVNGVWINNQPFGGGTYSLKGEDGTYSASSGTVVGDGNLSNNPLDPVTLTATSSYGGVTDTVRTTITTSSNEAATPGGLNANDSITLSTSTYVDAFNSGAGAYGGANIILNQAVVSTNSTASGKIALSVSAKINGNANAGPGGTPSSVITTSGGSSVTGTKSTLASPVVMNLPTPPSGMPSSSGSLTVSSGTTTISAANSHYSSITVNGTGILNITPNAVVLVDGSVQVTGSGQITLGAVGAVKLYVSGGFQVSSTGQVNLNTSDPTRFQVFLLAAGQNVTMDTTARMYAEVLAPKGSVTLTNSAQLYGNVICNQFTADSTTALHIDVGTGNAGSTTNDYGFKTVFGSKTKSVSSKQVATQVTISTGGVLQSITAYLKVGTTTRLIRFAIYSDSGGNPGTLLAQTANSTFGNNTLHWVTVITPSTTLAAGTYWLALSTNASGMYYYNNGTSTSGSTRYRNNAATTSGYLATWGTSDKTYTQSANIYATVVSGGVVTGITPPTLPVYSYGPTWGEEP